MQCTDVGDLIHAYLDGELDLVRALEMERHVADCARCGAIATRQGALRALLASTDVRHLPDPQLADRVRARLGAPAAGVGAPARADATPGVPSPPPTPERVRAIETRPRSATRPATAGARVPWRWALGGAVAAAASVLLVFRLVAPPSSRLVDEVVASHVRSLMVDHATDVASSDRHTVRPWFDGKLDFAPAVNDLASAGFPLLGGRLDYVGGRTVAALVYGRQKHVINVFVWPTASGAAERGAAPTTVHGYNVVAWTAGGMTYWAVSDLSAAELGDFASRMRDAAGTS
jgi:anti-sigma factor RsiW